MNSYNIPAITSDLQPGSESSLVPDVACLPISIASGSGGEQLQLYQIEVRSQGHLVAEHVIAASDALKAITLIEREYGEPIQMEKAVLEYDNDHRSRVMIAKHWHGYTFEARAIGS